MKIYKPTRQLLEHIAAVGPSSKGSLAQAFGLAQTSVNCHVNKLVRLGYLKRFGQADRIESKGPNPTAYALTGMGRGALLEIRDSRVVEVRMSADETVRLARASQPNSVFNMGARA